MKMAALVAVKTAALVVTMNYGAHIAAGLAYARFCMPQSAWEIAQSFVATASPVCSFLITTMQVTQNNLALVITTTMASLTAAALKPS